MEYELASAICNYLDRIAVALERLATNNEERLELLRQTNEDTRTGLEMQKRGLEISELTIPEIQEHRGTIGELVSALRGEDASQ